MTAEEREAAREWDRGREPSNKRMKQTKLSAAPWPEWRCRLMPAPAGLDAGTASQLIRGVRRTNGRGKQTIGEWGARVGPKKQNAIGPILTASRVSNRPTTTT